MKRCRACGGIIAGGGINGHFPTCPFFNYEPDSRHYSDCAVWLSDAPCDCEGRDPAPYSLAAAIADAVCIVAIAGVAFGLFVGVFLNG